MNGLLNVSSNPHIRSNTTTSSIMLLVVISLLPATGYGIFNFGIRALIIVLLCIAASVLFEYLFCKITHKQSTVSDLSCVVTGLLLALNLPAGVPFWLPVLGAFFAIVVVKMLFGGLGQNFMNPALGARCFLMISFSQIMTDFNFDTYSGPTPLALVKNGESVNLIDMVKGNIAGTIGETSTIALLIGAVFLILTGVIEIMIPVTYLISFVIFLGLLSPVGFEYSFVAANLCGGGLILGAFFMATDYVTRPITKLGQFIYGIFLGFLTCVIRVFGNSAEGVSYAIIIGNLLVPIIDKLTKPSYFGKGAVKND